MRDEHRSVEEDASLDEELLDEALVHEFVRAGERHDRSLGFAADSYGALDTMTGATVHVGLLQPASDVVDRRENASVGDRVEHGAGGSERQRSPPCVPE